MHTQEQRRAVNHVCFTFLKHSGLQWSSILSVKASKRVQMSSTHLNVPLCRCDEFCSGCCKLLWWSTNSLPALITVYWMDERDTPYISWTCTSVFGFGFLYLIVDSGWWCGPTIFICSYFFPYWVSTNCVLRKTTLVMMNVFYVPLITWLKRVWREREPSLFAVQPMIYVPEW